MFSNSIRAAGLLLAGALASLATHSSPASAQDVPPVDATCYGCTGGLAAPYLEFPAIPFPDGTFCQIRHNFKISNGKCAWDAPLCVPVQSCRWKYDVICNGNGCFDPATGLPRVVTGTWTFNGVPVFVQVPCGQSQDLGPIGCGTQASVTNIVYAPGAAGGPYLVALTMSASCAPCQDC